jgi:hypothetical protein
MTLATATDEKPRRHASLVADRQAPLTVEVDGQVDLRGTLAVDRSVRAGFQSMRCRTRLGVPEGTNARAVDLLFAAAERSCVVLDALRRGVGVTSDLELITPEDRAGNAQPYKSGLSVRTLPGRNGRHRAAPGRRADGQFLPMHLFYARTDSARTSSAATRTSASACRSSHGPEIAALRRQGVAPASGLRRVDGRPRRRRVRRGRTCPQPEARSPARDPAGVAGSA